MSRTEFFSPGATGISGLHSRLTRGVRPHLEGVEVLPAENAGALGLALRMCSEWSLGCWRKPQQTNVQGRVHRSGGVLAELANEIQGEFQRKHRLVRCWTSDQVLCSLFGSPEWVS